MDTCVVSEFVKPVPDVPVLMWFDTIQSELLYLSVLTIGELREGITRLPESKKKHRLSTWLQGIISDYSDRLLPVNLEIAENWGILQGRAKKEGKTLSAIDGLLASTSYTHNMILVTRNEKDFFAAKIEVLNPWNI
ncbi:type II toxin-antitoxin system VapC family toxin [candidate division CSSED10-310 bacterium]|uniref:Type II toxin-antitoxin system VapC family toxin n=1 Tax=candidate division CSSED10-310 bacterium TaxID=2855610 RepID=A0ABV6YVZ2_UNCC1